MGSLDAVEIGGKGFDSDRSAVGNYLFSAVPVALLGAYSLIRCSLMHEIGGLRPFYLKGLLRLEFYHGFCDSVTG